MRYAIHVNELRLDDALIPAQCWNTHVACLQRLCDAAGLGLDHADVAGITGLAFRTALCREATPPSLYHTWSWAEHFRVWLDALGLDAEVCTHDTRLHSFAAWLSRQHEQIAATLQRGFPVLYWDNLGFALILGAETGGYWVSGIPAQVVHPLWHGIAEARELLSRLADPRAPESCRARLVARECIAPVLDTAAGLVYVHGTAQFNRDQALLDGLYAAWRELTGRIEFPRVTSDIELAYEPRYGTLAFERWREELKYGRVHEFGQIMAVQSQAEARRWAAQYLRRVLPLIDAAVQPRLAQVAQFMEQVVAHWRPAQSAFDVPLNEAEQVTTSRWETCREALYQIQQTEGTASRVLGAIVRDMFGTEP